MLAAGNSAAGNTGVHVSFQIRVFVLSGCMPRSGIAGSHFSFLGNLHAVLHSDGLLLLMYLEGLLWGLPHCLS